MLGNVYKTVCLVRTHSLEGNILVDEYVKMSCSIHAHQQHALVGISGGCSTSSSVMQGRKEGQVRGLAHLPKSRI